MATRTTTTRTTAVGPAPSADDHAVDHAELSFADLVEAYFDCRRTKRNTTSALAFEANLERNLATLHDEPTTLFGGLLRCGSCGGALVATGRNTYGCATRRDRGPAVCAGVTAPRQATDETLLWHVRKDLQAPETIALMEQKAQAILARRARDSDDGATLAARVRELEREVARIVDAIASIGGSDALATRLRASETALRAARGAEERARVPTLPAEAKRLVRAVLGRLATALRGDLPAAREAMRTVFGEIVIRREVNAVFAEFEDTNGRLLRAAVGAIGSGCGGLLPDPVTRLVRIRIR